MEENEQVRVDIIEIVNNIEKIEVLEYVYWFLKEKLKVGN
jgi:hypothetical protein